MLPGFDEAVARFERWVCLLLLDGMQRAGLFTLRSEPHTLDSLRGRVAPEYARFVAEAVAILEKRGGTPLFPQRCMLMVVAPSHSRCGCFDAAIVL